MLTKRNGLTGGISEVFLGAAAGASGAGERHGAVVGGQPPAELASPPRGSTGEAWPSQESPAPRRGCLSSVRKR